MGSSSMMTDEPSPAPIPTDTAGSWASGDAAEHRLQSDDEQLQLRHEPHRSIIAAQRVHSIPKSSGRSPIWAIPGTR